MSASPIPMTQAEYARHRDRLADAHHGSHDLGDSGEEAGRRPRPRPRDGLLEAAREYPLHIAALRRDPGRGFLWWRPGVGLPGERVQCRNHRKVRVPGHQRKIELRSHRGDPNVVVRDQPPNRSEFRFHLSIQFAGAPIRQHENSRLQKLADESQLCFPPLGAKRAIVELAQDHPRHVQSRRGSQARGEVRVISEVRDDHVRVQQDTTSRVHRFSRSLPR